MNNKSNDEILKELRCITKLITLLATKDLTPKDQIATLANIGLQPKEISKLIGKTPNAVRVALVSIRRNVSKKGKRGKKQKQVDK